MVRRRALKQAKRFLARRRVVREAASILQPFANDHNFVSFGLLEDHHYSSISVGAFGHVFTNFPLPLGQILFVLILNPQRDRGALGHLLVRIKGVGSILGVEFPRSNAKV
jgi:hypothetical protein